MIDIKHIKTFIFNHAQYKMSDEKGNEIILKIDYKNNSYSLKNISKYRQIKKAPGLRRRLCYSKLVESFS